jgi:hypothetical protein
MNRTTWRLIGTLGDCPPRIAVNSPTQPFVPRASAHSASVATIATANVGRVLSFYNATIRAGPSRRGKQASILECKLSNEPSANLAGGAW